MPKILWTAIISALVWVVVISIIIDVSSLKNLSDWMSIVYWVVAPILLLSLIVYSGGHQQALPESQEMRPKTITWWKFWK